MAWNASDYVDVAQRIAEFRAQYPDGSLQPLSHDRPFWIERITGAGQDGKPIPEQTFICYAAAAYRHPQDERPGVGLAYEVFPGRTNFTRGSELQNAETSAWGRAIIAALAADSKKGVASAEEVRNRVAEREDAARPRKVSEQDAARAKEKGIPVEQERAERLAESHAVRDALGTKSNGEYRDPKHKAARSQPSAPDPNDPWTWPAGGDIEPQPMIGDDDV